MMRCSYVPALTILTVLCVCVGGVKEGLRKRKEAFEKREGDLGEDEERGRGMKNEEKREKEVPKK
jgi:hypothetical protein